MDNIYAKFDGVEGDCTDDKYAKWVPITSLNWGLVNAASGDRSKSGGGSKSIADHQEISLTGELDTSLTGLMGACLTGKNFDTVEIAVTRDSGEKKEESLRYELKNVYVSSYNVSASGGGDVMFQVGCNYGSIKCIMNKIDSKGAATGKLEAGWDREKNVKI